MPFFPEPHGPTSVSRSDGRFAGTLRLLITDGYPLAEPLPEPVVQEE